MTSYLLPFEIASVVLLVALVGAAMVARFGDIHLQSLAGFEDRILQLLLQIFSLEFAGVFVL